MYCQYYGFREKPFSLPPNPEFLFLSQKHEMALNLLELGVLNQSGFCVISGEIGAGKTTLVRELLNRLDERVRVGLISNTHSASSDLLSWILEAFELDSASNEAVFQHRRFTDFTIEEYAKGKHTLLIIDEAQNLSLSALEQLRMLSNINSEKDLVLQVILVGQNELRTKLQQPELRQFAQRVAIDYHLSALDQEETAAYIKHRVNKSGRSQQLFDDDACRLVCQYSGGIPRLINRICDLSLVYGFSKDREIIGADLVKAVAEYQDLDLARKEPAKDPAGSHHYPETTIRTGGHSDNRATRSKEVPEREEQRARQSESAFKGNNRKQSGDNPISKKPAELKPPQQRAAKNTVMPVKAGDSKTPLPNEASSPLYAPDERASAVKSRAGSRTTEKNHSSETISEEAKSDLAFVEKAAAEKLIAVKEVPENMKVKREVGTVKPVESKAKITSEASSALCTAAEKASAERAQAESIATEKDQLARTISEKAKADIAFAEQAAAENLAAEKELSEKLAAEQAAVKLAEASMAAEKLARSEKFVAEKTATEFSSATEQANESAIRKKQTADELVAEKIRIEKQALKEASAAKAEAEKALADRIAAEKAAAETAAAADAAISKAAANRVTAEKAAADMVSDAEAAARSALDRQANAERTASVKAAAAQAAAEKARKAIELAQAAATERTSIDSATLGKAALAQQAIKTAAASRAAAEKALAEKNAADAIVQEKVSLERIALAKVAVSVAAAAQQAADRAATARNAAQQEASEKEKAAIAAARKAAEASALAERAAADSHIDIDVAGIYIEKQPGMKSQVVSRSPATGNSPQIAEAILAHHQPRTKRPRRRTRTILAVTVVSVIVAASTWIITRSNGTGTKSPPVAAGKSFTIPERATEAAALESGIRKSAF